MLSLYPLSDRQAGSRSDRVETDRVLSVETDRVETDRVETDRVETDMAFFTGVLIAKANTIDQDSLGPVCLSVSQDLLVKNLVQAL